jgi:hypothetical protein
MDALILDPLFCFRYCRFSSALRGGFSYCGVVRFHARCDSRDAPSLAAHLRYCAHTRQLILFLARGRARVGFHAGVMLRGSGIKWGSEKSGTL